MDSLAIYILWVDDDAVPCFFFNDVVRGDSGEDAAVTTSADDERIERLCCLRFFNHKHSIRLVRASHINGLCTILSQF